MSSSENPTPRSTLAFIGFLARSFPRQTLRTTVLIVLAGAAEASGVATLVPTLNTAIRSGGPPVATNSFERALEGLLGWVGLPYTLVTLVLLVTTFMAAKGLFQWLSLRAGGRAMAKIATDFRLRIVANLFRARWSFFVQQPIGGVASAVGHETYVTAHAYLAMCQLFAAVSLALVYVAAIAVISPPSALLAVLVGLALVLPLRLLLRYVHTTATTEARSQKNFVTNLLNAIQSIKPIRAMGSEEAFEARARSDADELEASISRQVSVTYLMPAIQEPILVLGISIFLVAGSYFFDQDFPTLAVTMFAFWRSGVHIGFANRSYRELTVAQPYYRGLQDMLDASQRARAVDVGTREVPAPPITVEFEEVSFSHGSDPVLDGLSMQIPAGAITALVGESGIGKTTVMDLLLGLHSPARGQILVNGVPLGDIAAKKWRRRLGYVPQETTLFHGTVLDNVTMGDPTVGEEEALEALARAGATAFINELENGLHTVVGEQGGRLSGGQRQRIAIARALVREPALLILDEVTASLDPVTEATVMESIRALRPSVTVVMATHQQALLGIADVVYRLREGRATREPAPAVGLPSSRWVSGGSD